MSEMASESLLNFVGKYTKNDREVAVCQRRGYRMESWTYARIIGQANRVARELEVRGLGKGDAALSWGPNSARSEEHTSELQSRFDLVCRLLLEKKKIQITQTHWR